MDREVDLRSALLRTVPSLVLGADGTILAVGEAARLRLGLLEDGLVGRSLEECFPTEGPDPTLRRGPAHLPPEERRLLRTRGLPAGEDERLLLLEDETALERARSECLRLTRLATAGRLISGIVHEINNPLSGIVGYCQLLLMRDLDPELRASIEKVHGEALRTSRIVRNLLDFARRKAVRTGRVELARILRKALELKGHDLRLHNVSVHLDLPDDLPCVAADGQQLLQVFVNLLGNSEQAMYESDRGGRLTLKARANGEVVTLEIADTGPGIPESLRDRVFEPFFTTKPEGQGTGLGLALCREMLRAHSGTIQLVDRRRRGATFLLTLPVHRSDPRSAPRSRAGSRPVTVRNRRIVVVEDDPVCRDMLREAFERAGNHVAAFDRSEPALDYLRRHPADVIVTDLHRPGLNGLEFHRCVLRADPRLARRVIFLTGDTLNDEFVRFLHRERNPFLPKPVQLQDLFAAVARLLAPEGRQTTLFEDPPAGPLGAQEST